MEDARPPEPRTQVPAQPIKHKCPCQQSSIFEGIHMSCQCAFTFAAWLLVTLFTLPLSAGVVAVKHSVFTGDDNDNDGKFDNAPAIWAPIKGKKRQTSESYEMKGHTETMWLSYSFCEDPECVRPPFDGQTPCMAGVGWHGPGGLAGFYHQGFFDLIVDGVGLGHSKAQSELLTQGESVQVQFTWELPGVKNSKRSVRALFEYSDDLPSCLLATFELTGEPPAEWHLELLTYPAGFPWARGVSNYEVTVFSPSVTAVWQGQTIPLPPQDAWLLQAETKMSPEDRAKAGALSCAVIWTPSEVEEVRMDKNNRTFIRFKTGMTKAHVVLCEFPLQNLAQCQEFMRKCVSIRENRR